jgi:hypothetical protein
MKYNKLKFFTLIIFLGSLATSCYYDREDELYPKTAVTCDGAAAKYSTDVKVALDRLACTSSGCHGSGAAGGIQIETYDNLKAYITRAKANFLGSIKHTSGFSAMPKGGGKLTDTEICKIEGWITAGMPNN